MRKIAFDEEELLVLAVLEPDTRKNTIARLEEILPEVKDEENDSEEGGLVDMKKIDPNFADAARLVVTSGRASTSYLQTQMGMGFARSARVMSQLEAAGIVGPQDPRSKNREVLVKNFTELDEILKRYLK